MSLVLSPKSGKLVTVGSSQFSEILADPKYRNTVLLPPPNLQKGTVSPSGLPPLSNSLNLPPLPQLKSPSLNLPPLPQRKSPSLNLPPLPVSPMYSPPSPSSSLQGVSMPLLPQLPKIEISPLNTKNLPPLKIPTLNNKLPPVPKSPLTNSVNILPPLPKSPSLPPLNNKLPPLPKSPSLPPLKLAPLPKSPSVDEILEMEFASIPSLEETLRNTNQPAKRAKLEEMIATKKYQEGRGIKTRGWAARAPTKGKERHQLHAECGDKCFLNPEQEKFPICASPRTTGGKSKCEIDVTGLQTAYNRAKQYGYTKEAEKAKILLKKYESKKLPQLSPSTMVAAKMDYEKKDYLMPRRVARRNVRRTMYDNEPDEMSWDHKDKQRENKDEMNKPQKMVWTPNKDWDKDEGKDYVNDWDREDRVDNEQDESFNPDYTQKGDYSVIRLSPSMTRFGSIEKKKVHENKKMEEDCGCGN